MDAIWDKTDTNGFPQNPEWGTQTHGPTNFPPPQSPPECVRQPYLSSCTSQISPKEVPPNQASGRLDEPVYPNLLICSLEPGAVIHGHANWTVAEFSGALAWAGIAFDGDYNFALVPADFHGITQANEKLPSGERYIEAEFASAETADNFQTNWWQNFRNAVESFDDSAVESLITPSSGNLPQTVVQGLFGLDCEHDCHSELHPVYALAIEIEDKGDDNTWAIFVRNWGNEGFCSQFDHQLQTPGNRITMFLPRVSAGAPMLLSSTEFNASDKSTTPFPTVEHVAGQGTKLTFTLPPPDKHSLAELILHMKWSGDTYAGVPGAIHPPQPFSVQSLAPEARPEQGQRDAEEYLELIYRNKQPRNRMQFRPTPPGPGSKNLLQESPTAKVVEALGAAANQAPTNQKKIRSKSVPDKQKLIRDCESIRRVCIAYGGNPPSDRIQKLPEICAQLQSANACAALPGRSNVSPGK
jgi:hypothetical protein